MPRKAVALVLPQLKGKLNGIALRVPTPNVSVVDMCIQTEKKCTPLRTINAAFREAAEGPMKGILAVADAPLVSIDFRCADVSTTIDASLTMVMGDDLIKVVAWYDNEWGYSQRVVDLASSPPPSGASNLPPPCSLLTLFIRDAVRRGPARVWICAASRPI